jgi:hypothetical protein
MNTILDKVDPQYMNCMSGACEHIEHKVNALWWIIPVVVLTYLYGKVKVIRWSNIRRLR